MKKIMLCLLLMACSPNKETVSIIKGDPGNDGLNGADGVSSVCTIVSNEEEDGALISCDDSSFFVHNGLDGATGAAGAPGLPGEPGAAVLVTDYTLGTACVAVAGTSYYVKKNGTTRAFYTGSTCASNTKAFELGEGDTYWVSATMQASYLDVGIRTISL